MSKDTCDIADYYGLSAQLLKLAEECTELADIAFKSWKKSLNNHHDIDKDHLAEEIADVKLVSEQVSYLLELGDKVSNFRKYKIKRQVSRMKRERKKNFHKYKIMKQIEED